MTKLPRKNAFSLVCTLQASLHNTNRVVKKKVPREKRHTEKCNSHCSYKSVSMSSTLCIIFFFPSFTFLVDRNQITAVHSKENGKTRT